MKLNENKTYVFVELSQLQEDYPKTINTIDNTTFIPSPTSLGRMETPHHFTKLESQSPGKLRLKSDLFRHEGFIFGYTNSKHYFSLRNTPNRRHFSSKSRTIESISGSKSKKNFQGGNKNERQL